MQPGHYLRCLGQPALFAPNGEPIRFRTKKHLALLVYLKVEQARSHRRDRLAELLWPKADLPEARHSLATALCVLRPRVGTRALEASREHVRLLAGHLNSDLDRLLAGNVLESEAAGPLEVAAFLDGFDIPDAHEFGLWRDRQQARLLPMIKDAMLQLIDRSRRTANSRQMEQLADRMLELDELSEEAVRAKMEARAFAGDRLTALRVFEEWRNKLTTELLAVPSDLLEGMAVRLRRRGWERNTLANIPSVPTDQWRGRAFVGRANEFRFLYEAWEGLGRGSASHPIVLGDSGLGKTTLVERLTTAAGLEGAAVSRVQCYQMEREIPFATVANLVTGLIDRPGVSGTPPDALVELSRTVPAVRRRFPSIQVSQEIASVPFRPRLAEAFYEMLQAISEESPVILVIDDLHHADDASLVVLHHVLKRGKSQRLMAIMTARPDELSRSAKASKFIDEGKRLGIRELELPPLDLAESKALLDSLMSPIEPGLSAPVRKALLKASAGYPMVMELLATDWQENRSKSLVLVLDSMTAELCDDGKTPGIYREVLERIARTLESGTQSVLNLAAILGRRLNDVSLYSLVDLSVGQTMSGMAELVRRRVLRDAGSGLEFANELVRTAAYLGVPSPLRRLLHASVADRFIEAEASDNGSLGLEIAWHCTRAGRLDEAIPHLLRGARHSLSVGATHAAEIALTSALGHLQGSAKAEAYLLLVEVLQEEGRWLESLDVLELIAKEFGNESYPERLAFSAMAKSLRGGADLHRISVDLESLIELVSNGSSMKARVVAGRTLAYLAAERIRSGDFERIIAILEAVQSEETEPGISGELALARARLYLRLGRSYESLSLVREGIAILERHGYANLTLAQLYVGQGTILTNQGKYAEAIEQHRKALLLAGKLGNDSLEIGATGNLMLCYCRLGQYDDVLRLGAAVGEILGTELTEFSEIQIAYCTALSHAMQQRSANALRVVAGLDARLVGSIVPWMKQAWLLWKADILRLLRQESDALDVGRSALAMSAGGPLSVSFVGPYSRWLALVSEADRRHRDCDTAMKSLLSGIDQYDSIDQAEVLCAADYWGRIRAVRTPDLRQKLTGKLDELPLSIRTGLVQLGMLETANTTER